MYYKNQWSVKTVLENLIMKKFDSQLIIVEVLECLISDAVSQRTTA